MFSGALTKQNEIQNPSKKPFEGQIEKREKKRHTDSKTPSLRRQGFTSRSYKMTPLRTK